LSEQAGACIYSILAGITKLNRPITRETLAFDRSDAIIVTLYPRHMELRLKGERAAVTLTYGAAFDLARKLSARRPER